MSTTAAVESSGHATLASAVLGPLSGVYAAIIHARNRYYDRFRGAVKKAAIPIISVGNLTVGGTGKTPMVIEVAQRLRALGKRPAVLTRGYHARAGGEADEVMELREAIADMPVVVNPVRVQGATTAMHQHSADCAILDDGFQHRRLYRDLDIVLVDALNPWGGGRLLPAGRLREPLSALQRADVVVLTRTTLAAAETVESLISTIRTAAPDAIFFRATVSATRVQLADASTHPPSWLADRYVIPVCGIGNPDVFTEMLRSLKARLAPPLVYRDHHHYSTRDVERIVRAAERQPGATVVTTRKDWVKLFPLIRNLAGPPFARLDIGMAIADPSGTFNDRLQRAVRLT